MDQVQTFETERRRLTAIASRILDDPREAEDIVQTVWMRFDANRSELANAAAWLTTVTTRLCLDRLKARIPAAAEAADRASGLHDPAAAAERMESLGQALHIVQARLTPHERVTFVLADTFGFDFETIGGILDRSAAAARQLASRARRKVAGSEPDGPASDADVVDAFLSAARGGDLERLLHLLAPDAEVSADASAILAGTPASVRGRDAVAGFFNGSARAALPVLIAGRPGAAWVHRGQSRVAFDFTIADGLVHRIVFRADPDLLESVISRRTGPAERER